MLATLSKAMVIEPKEVVITGPGGFNLVDHENLFYGIIIKVKKTHSFSTYTIKHANNSARKQT